MTAWGLRRIDKPAAHPSLETVLRSEFPFRLRSWTQRLLAFLLGEAFLGFLAIAAVALTLTPWLFQVPTRVDACLEAGQWSIIALFALEYILALSHAADRRAFVLNPWRVIDLLTIVVPLLTLVPGISDWLRSSPVLRLIRLIRVVALGVRASGVVVREEARRGATSAVGAVEVTVLQAGGKPGPASYAEFLRWIKAPGDAWYNVANLSPDQIKEVAETAGIAPAFIESHLGGSGYPHLDSTGRYAALFVWIPEAQAGKPIERHGFLLLATRHGLFTLSQHHVNALQVVSPVLGREELATLPFTVRILCAFLKAVLDRHEEIVAGFERELRALEDLPVRESRQQFFEHTFRLKKQLSTAQSDLWRMKGILASLAEARAKLPGSDGRELDFLRRLAEDADYLYETVVNTREGVLSLIDLHLNVVSFEMNRVMRVLAVVSVLGLIPAVVGGLFGMNLADNPWPFTLSQVSFGVGLAMVLCLYLFLVKGWLR